MYRNHQGCYKGDAALHTILLLHMEESYCTSRFFHFWESANFLSVCIAFFVWTYIMDCAVNCNYGSLRYSRQNWRYNNSSFMHDFHHGNCSHSVKRWSKKNWFPLLTSLTKTDYFCISLVWYIVWIIMLVSLKGVLHS